MNRTGEIQRGEDSIPGQIRRFYTSNYSMLDRFDSLWYQSRCRLKSVRWETAFVWNILHQGVINSYVAFLKAKEGESQVTIQEFLLMLITDYTNAQK